ncbi:MAG: beta-ketoacyl synthase N-terminal-like domain-containing protein [Planctomycetota bacterium]|nr:beta-ketoacyl synthase N-terminal-like domain-containing protein [Planctomycetota bacterium]
MIDRQPSDTPNDNGFSSLADLLRCRAEQRPHDLAYLFLVDGQAEGARLTYEQLFQKAQAISERLLGSAQRFDRALLLYPPGHEFLLAFFGCLQAGVIAIPLPPPDGARIKRALPRLESVIRDARATLVLTTSDIHAALRSHFEKIQEFRQVRWIDTEQVSENQPPNPAQRDQWRPSPEDIAFLQYTSGSTSAPKGVMVSHANVLQQCRALAGGARYDSNSIAATWMPYHHDYGLIEGLLQPLLVGIPCYFMSPLAFIKRPIRWLEAISRYRVTHSQAPNFAYDLCVRKITDEQRSTIDLSSWVSAANAAEPVRPETLHAFYEAFKMSGLRWEALAPAYGLAEATLIVTHTPPGEGPTLLKAELDSYERGVLCEGDGERTRSVVSCGRALEQTRVEIVNPESRVRCKEGEVGEIWVAGPSVAEGYWNRTEDSEETFRARLADTGEGPFLRTGDLGAMRDGQLYVTGREKDLIIIRGLNHYPQDIELTVESSHPALRPGHGAAFSVEVDREEELVVVQEVQGKHLRDLDSEQVLAAIRAAVFDEHELRVYAVALLKSGGAHKTTSGKIQRQVMKSGFLDGTLDVAAEWRLDESTEPTAIAVPEGGTPSEPRSSRPTSDSISRWIANWIAERCGADGKLPDRSSKFADVGLDSLRAAGLADDLEQWLQRRVDPTVFWSFPTIDALAEHLSPSVDHARSSGTSHNELARKQHRPADTIAIVGMACRFPGGVDSPEAYWQLLRDGADAVSEIPRERWNIDDYYDPDPNAPGKIYARHGCFIRDVDKFDSNLFGITPREAEELDPQQRLLLEVVWESLERAGIAASKLRGSDTGVFVGMSWDDATQLHNGNHLADINPYSTLGSARSIAAGRIAYVLDLHGPVVQLDTACSSSLVSVYQACESLQTGECDLALAGGVSLMLSPATMVALCKLTALAPDGRGKTFDAAADGYVRGEGCGMVVLKRMSDAVRDGDTILAQIRSAAVNHDGASNGLTAPNGQAQEQLMRKALLKAGLTGREVTYVEAHGTGTELGDPIELNALNAVYGEHRPLADALYVGAAKSNIGHLEAAAGIAGLLKVVLMLQHGEIPPQLHVATLNPHVEWDRTPLKVPLHLLPWPRSASRRLAAVSAFGFSGTNAHVIVEAEATRTITTPDSKRAQTSLHCLPLSAHSLDALKVLAERYAGHLTAHLNQRIEDICFTAATARDHAKHRLMVIAASRDELLAKLRAYASCEDTSQVVLGNGRAHVQDASNRVGFLFTGQGTQYVGMGRELYDSQPVFRAAIDRCGDALRAYVDVPLAELLYGESSTGSLLDQTIYTQPALFSLQYALVELWKSWGVRPDAVMGHSLGEYSAACAAGVFDLESGLELVATRARLMDSLPRTGIMAVVMADESRVQDAIEPYRDQVSIASVNGPETIVISGPREAVQQVLDKLAADGIDVEILNTSNAGHSAVIDPMLDAFGELAEKFHYAVPRIDMISNVSGGLAGDEVAGGSYWVRHARVPVRFADGMKALAAAGCGTFVEIGPNPNLLAMGMACVKGLRPRHRWLPSLTKGRGSWETMLYSLGSLYVSGADIDWQCFHQSRNCERVALPTYPFQRLSYPIRPYDHAPSSNGHEGEKSHLPSPAAVAATLDHLRTGLEDESRALTPRLDEAAILFVIEALEQLGFAWHAGAEFSEAEVLLRLPEPNRPKVTRVLKRLVERGLLQHAGGQFRVVMARPAGVAKAMLDTLQQEADYPECDLMRRAGSALASIWQGKLEPLSVLFPGGATDQASAFYSRSRLLAKYNEMAGEMLREAVSRMPAGVSLRVLEVGAGTGGLTAFLLPHLPAERCDYVFTDVSPLFLHAAYERFSEYPFLQTELLDIGKPLREQGFESGSFDLVVAANVLHATPRLHDTLRHVREVLKPGGWLMLLEAANPPLWGDAIFTLIDGWWNFEDTDLRPDYPLMRRDRWAKVLQEAGFEDVACLNDAESKDDSNNTLYLAQTRNSALPRPIASARGADRDRKTGANDAAHMSSEVPSKGTVWKRGTLGDSLIDVFDQEELSVLVLNHAARVMRLKPEEIELTQPLAELGLDSLMATELRAQLGQTLGRELSLNSLQMRRSIQEIAQYVREDQTQEDAFQAASGAELRNLEVNAQRAHLVPLQPKGTKTPLFFIPAGYGDLFAFHDIAHAIGLEQPVYGLQPASAKRVKTFRQMSIYRLVSAYISEIKKVQPDGPYFLSGYSAGGIIVVELARELVRQGNEVGLLVIFDPPSHVPFWLDWFYAVNYRISVATRLIHVVRRFRSKFARRLFHTVLDEGLRTHTSVTREHRVAPYPGRITHFRARLSQTSLVSMKPIGWFWRHIAKQGIEEHWIPGTHYGMLRGPGASVVVDELRDCLQRAEASQSKHPASRQNKPPRKSAATR